MKFYSEKDTQGLFPNVGKYNRVQEYTTTSRQHQKSLTVMFALLNLLIYIRLNKADIFVKNFRYSAGVTQDSPVICKKKIAVKYIIIKLNHPFAEIKMSLIIRYLNFLKFQMSVCICVMNLKFFSLVEASLIKQSGDKMINQT